MNSIISSPMSAALLALFLSLAIVEKTNAISWRTSTTVASGPQAGALCATAVDRAGRVHTVYTIQKSTIDELWYRVRPNSTAGFSSGPAQVILMGTFNSANVPRHLAIDVTSDFIVQVAVVKENGTLEVYERDGTSSSAVWSSTPEAGLAFTGSQGGVSICSRGTAGAERSAIVFCGGAGTTRYIEQQSPGNWGSVFSLTTGADSGYAPVLTYSRSADGELLRTVAFYDQAMAAVRINRFTVNAAGAVTSQAAETVRSAPNFTRVDLDGRDTTLGIAFVVSGSTQQTMDGVFYATRNNDLAIGAANAWPTQTVAPSTEVDPDAAEAFSPIAALALDAAGNPWVAYSRLSIPILLGRNLDLRASRLVPGIGWKSSIVETFSSAGLGFYFTNCISLDAGDNGDPALIYERDRQTASDVVFARPLSEPWAVERPLDLNTFSNSFAPAIASGPDGTHHLLTSTTTGGLLFGPPLSYQPPSLVSFSGGTSSRVRLPSSNNFHPANALVIDNGGSVHTASLRLVNETDSEGNIPVFTRPPGGSFEFRGLAANDAATGEVAIGIDGSGRLYVAHRQSSGGARIRTLAPGASGSSSWETLTSVSLAQGIDLAVRADGGVALSYFNPIGGPGVVRLHSNFDPRRGTFLNSFDNYDVFALGSRDAAPKNTSCLILDDNLPRVAFALRGPVKYSRPAGAGLLNFSTREPITGFIDATIDMVARGHEIHLVAHTSSGDGTLRHITFNDLAAGRFSSSSVFYNPALELSSRGQSSVGVTLDAGGFPVMATSLRIPGGGFPLFFPAQDSSVLARPGDALDADSDGIPILLEGAHCLDPSQANSKSLLPTGQTSRSALGTVNLSFRFRAPDTPSMSGNGGFQHGEFTYRYETGNDLLGWGPEMPSTTVTGLLFPIIDVSGAPGCVTTGTGFRYAAPYVQANPRRFSRLRVVRDR